jgi:UDP-N-acetylglucosamine 2-epimerase (non-hydrolysing)
VAADRTSLFLVVAARPDFVKAAPVYHALRRADSFDIALVHTGQHYDDCLTGSFVRDLSLPDPLINLRVGSGSHAVQVARTLERFEPELYEHEPELVVVVGDVNSACACALAAAKVVYPDGRRPRVAHVEAGLRSFDRRGAEEINRVLCDGVSDFLFVSEECAIGHLHSEGIDPARIFFVGNVTIDTLRQHAAFANELAMWTRFGHGEQRYGVVTLHRPSNVDDDETLECFMRRLFAVSAFLPLVFPVHPRTRATLERLQLPVPARLHVCEPLPYIEFLSLMMKARLVLTDSRGIQDETTCLGVPCLTVGDRTERPVTISHGTNRIIGTRADALLTEVRRTLRNPLPRAAAPPFWDGVAAARIVDVLANVFSPYAYASRS